MEKAAIKVIQQNIPKSFTKGSVFHLRQSIIRPVTDKRSSEEPTFNSDKRFINLLGLLLFPVNMLVRRSFYGKNDKKFKDYMDYIILFFDEPYVNGRTNCRAKTVPRYSVPLLNDERTNNATEGFHNRISHTMEANHPSLAKFFNELIKGVTFQKTIMSGMEIGWLHAQI